MYPLSDISMYVILKEDAHNFDNTQKSKTKFLVKGISAADVHAAAMRMLVANPSLNPNQLSKPRWGRCSASLCFELTAQVDIKGEKGFFGNPD